MTFEHIESRKGPGGTSVFISGTGVRVVDIARLFRMLQTEMIAERINESLPHLTPAQVRDALRYWATHKEEIDTEIEEESKLLESLPTAI
jgi:uncharacterized protein (DUF433 family)